MAPKGELNEKALRIGFIVMLLVIVTYFIAVGTYSFVSTSAELEFLREWLIPADATHFIVMMLILGIVLAMLLVRLKVET